jgi:hypothetical protein
MARFVSQYKGYSHGVRNGQESYLGPDGRMVPGLKPLEAAFEHELMDEEAILVAKKSKEEGGLANSDPLKPPFHGMQENEAGREYDITPRLALFDSERAQLKNEWTDEEREIVEAALRNSTFYGNHFVEVVPTPPERPWRGYDDITDADRILDLAVAIDADLNQVIAYEAANQNRLEVLRALEQVRDAVAEETTVVTA